ncbi:secreted RxLR effector protein 161-like [Carya illinoinensis]|uniref:secreted RxLR effector protein 161-like n=1 Tax=Carya illinoinensis TaxID=32201 RepID=UPI001C725F7E|nr:secreted RxLR effector protein 161-like [Carya illinoinensis]
MDQIKPVSTPLGQHFKLSTTQAPQTESEMEFMHQIPYASIVGSVMYATVCTRPDLIYAVSVVSRFMSNPVKAHWQAIKWLLRYISGTTVLGLKYGNNVKEGCELEGFVDADYAGSVDTRKSLTGYVFTAFGGAISWKSNLQSVVALSTTEVEYIALTEAIKEAIWLNGISHELGIFKGNITIHCDNQSSIHLAKNQVFHERSKHIDVRLHFVRDVIESREVRVEKIPKEENPSDMMTKSLPLAKFKHCLNLINMKTVGVL